MRRPHLDLLTVDRVLAVVLTVVAEAQILGGGAANHLVLAPALIAPAMTIPVAFRRRWPAGVGLWVSVVATLQIAIWGDPQAVGVTIGYLCAMYGLAVWSETRHFVAVVAISVLIGPPVAALGPHTTLANSVLFTTVVVVAMLIARRVIRGRDERALLAQRERDVIAREAVVEERARIARELNDAIAHNVSMVVMQAGAERRVLEQGEGSPHEVLQTIEETGRTALTEMRRLVGMLRSDVNEPLSPQPGLADLATLVERERGAGKKIELRVTGEPRALPLGVDLAAYRIVQEALAGAGAEARVDVRYDANSIELEIVDDGSPPEESTLAISERVSLYGGRMETGQRGDGGFGMRVVLPVR
jgi:signal transduction histidine kinase